MKILTKVLLISLGIGIVVGVTGLCIAVFFDNNHPSPTIPKPKVIKYSNCGFIVKKPYYLIKFKNGKYGIMKKDTYMTWYMIKDRSSHDFDENIYEDLTLMTTDSCDAKEQLADFLKVRDSYKYEIISK